VVKVIVVEIDVMEASRSSWWWLSNPKSWWNSHKTCHYIWIRKKHTIEVVCSWIYRTITVYILSKPSIWEYCSIICIVDLSHKIINNMIKIKCSYLHSFLYYILHETHPKKEKPPLLRTNKSYIIKKNKNINTYNFNNWKRVLVTLLSDSFAIITHWVIVKI